MPFSATVAITGVPNFGLIDINPEETARALQVYLNTASKLTGVSLDDIELSVTQVPTDMTNVTLVQLLEVGMKLFDAIVWLTAGKPASHPLVADPGMLVKGVPSLHDVARSVFFCYFMLVVQARYPASSRVTEKPTIPNFLRTIMGMDDDQSVYVERICSFEPQKFDPTWAKYVRFEGFGQEVLSRFGLGVAGYRYFGPFGLYTPRTDLPVNLKEAYEFARTVAKAPASWDIHPLTRHPNVLTNRGNLNKNLANLILECFTQEQIDEMVKAKVIFGLPKKEPTHRNYTQWTRNDDITGTVLIFRPSTTT